MNGETWKRFSVLKRMRPSASSSPGAPSRYGQRSPNVLCTSATTQASVSSGLRTK